jgi:hypothetical protein
VGGSSLRFETGLELFLRQCVYSGVVHVRARFMIFFDGLLYVHIHSKKSSGKRKNILNMHA